MYVRPNVAILMYTVLVYLHSTSVCTSVPICVGYVPVPLPVSIPVPVDTHAHMYLYLYL